MLNLQKEEFYIRALIDHVVLERDEYEKMRKELQKVNELEKQVGIYREILDVIVDTNGEQDKGNRGEADVNWWEVWGLWEGIDGYYI